MGNVYGSSFGDQNIQSSKTLSTGESAILYLTFLIGEYQSSLSCQLWAESFCPSGNADQSDSRIKWFEQSLKELRETRTRLEQMIAERGMV